MESIRVLYKIDMARKNMTTSIENDLQKEIKKLAIDLERHVMILWRRLLKEFSKSTKRNLTNKNLSKLGQMKRIRKALGYGAEFVYMTFLFVFFYLFAGTTVVKLFF